MDYFLFLDYDGTLTPIVKRPGMAQLSAPRRSLLKRLARSPHFAVAIVSGRMLPDVKKKVGIKGFYYVGNHGFEIAGPKLKFTHPKARTAKPILRRIKNGLLRRLKGIKGVIIEDKVLTMSLHYRLVRQRDLEKVKITFHALTQPHLKNKKIRITHGKKVFEIRPNARWDKGRAVLWLLKKRVKGRKVTPVYIGDDTTDEDAFRALGKRGITIHVGRAKQTLARRRLNDVQGVYRFLSRLALEFRGGCDKINPC